MTAHEIAEHLEARMHAVLAFLYPEGRVIAGEFCVGSLRGEPGESLKVHLNGKGPVWSDFATGETGRDLLDLWTAARHHGDIRAAMREAGDWLGVPPRHERRQATADRLHPIPTAHYTLGPASSVHVYRDPAGRPIGAALRWDRPDGSKEIRPYDAVEGRWGFPKGRRPLYHLDVLAKHPAAPVVMVEGERKADQLAKVLEPHGYVVTTCWGGAKSTGKADLAPLDNRPRVILWPDADPPGHAYIEAIARAVRELDPFATLLVVTVPADVPTAWDATDALGEGRDVLAMVRSAQPFAEPPHETAVPPESAQDFSDDARDTGGDEASDHATDDARDEEVDPLEAILIPAGTLTVEAMEANQPEFAITHLAPCEVTTLFSALGGTGKTLLLLQMLIEQHLGLPIWGCEHFTPRPRTWIYFNTEDGKRWIYKWAAPLLRAYQLDTFPADIVPMKELATVPTLDAALGRRLARIAEDRGHGGVVLDPKSGLIPGSLKIIDSTGLRQFMREGLHPIEKTGAAVIVSDHDNRLGQAVGGAQSQQDYARLVLHVVAGEKTERVRRFTIEHGKDNSGFPFEQIELERDNQTLVSRVVRTQQSTDGASEPCPPDGPDRRRALRRLALDFIASRPTEDARSKEQAIAWMLTQAQDRWGTGRSKVGRDQIRDFLNAFGTWRPRSGQGGGQVLVTIEEVDR
jgi:hypothetical protein